MAVYRFGSQVKGTVHSKSDIDLAVLACNPLVPGQLAELQQNLAVVLNCDVDLIDLRAVSTVMQMQVLSTGECLLCEDVQAREVFEMIVYASYARLNEERAGILDDVRARGSVYAG
ncbi:MAG: nucleotidyltransferase domain-containing protein [Nitrospirales bacterium]